MQDNMATDVSFGLNTSAGSFALLGSIPPDDTPSIAQLRKAGAIILGKGNMSVWSQWRGKITQGWSPRGGYTSSAYLLHGNACSSSSGAGVAASVGLSAASIGTETEGSIICPASRNGVVGLKPTVGLVSRFGVIPISPTQDTPGPLVKSVEDAAVMLTYMKARRDPLQTSLDGAILAQPRKIAKHVDYEKRLLDLALERQALPLKGVRIGVLGGLTLNATLNDFDEQVVNIYYQSLTQLEAAGATLVNVSLRVTSDQAFHDTHFLDNRFLLLSWEFEGELHRSTKEAAC
jgi:amidase